MLHVRNAGHLDFDWDCDLLLDLFRRSPGPLGDDLDVVVGDVRICLYGKIVERDDSPCEEQDREAQHQPAIVQRKIDEALNHLSGLIYCSAEFCSSRAFDTTCWPGFSPELISC